MDSLNTAVLTVDRTSRVRYINSAAEVLLTHSRDRTVERTLVELVDDGQVLCAAVERVWQVPQTITVRELVVRSRVPHSDPVNVDCTVSTLEPHASDAVLIEMNRVDRLTRIAREQSTRARREANRAVMRGLAHEIKNPLGGLRGAAQLLGRELENRELREYTRIITHEADRLAHLVDRMTGARRNADPTLLNIHEVVEHVRKLVLVEVTEGIELKCDYDPSLPPVYGDRVGLTQAVLNIVRNSLDALQGRGRIELRTRIAHQRTVDDKPYRQMLRVDLTDNGPGVPESLGAQVFEPMVTGRPEGTGLGLAIAQDIVAQHDGLIEFESHSDRTCFSIFLPVGEMAETGRVWVVDDDPSIRWVLGKALSKAGIASRSFSDGAEALDRLAGEKPGVIVTDVRMPGMSGLELMESVHRTVQDVPVIVMTAYSDLDSAVASFQGGAFEYLSKPFDLDDAVALVKRALDQVPAHPTERRRGEGLREIVGEAPAMQAVFRAVGRLSASSMNVLIRGESGTGKELLATALHRTSPRTSGPFVAINTAAIPTELLESELFGHARGAFTGAQTQRAGRFEQADGGTLFLDEIGDMPLALQTRLLRVLSEGRFFRVGGHSEIAVDVRIIAATHQDLETKAADGTFREDLFHRLNVIQITLPPLRERVEDIPGLAARFLNQAAEELGVTVKSLTPEAEAALLRCPWPGNVRELENLCRRLTVMAPGRTVGMSDLPGSELRSQTSEIEDSWVEALRVCARERLEHGAADVLGTFGRNLERCLIEEALRCTGGHKQEAARRLGLGRNTLTRKLRELGSRNG